jgi:hypothetical protein
MMGPSLRAVERLHKITTGVLSFDNDTAHLLLDQWLRRYFFPKHTRSEPRSTLHGAVSLFADRFAQRKFDGMIQSICREPTAAQYLSDGHTAHDFVHDNEFERMIHCDLTSQFSQPFH